MTPDELDALTEAERAFERAAGTPYGHSVYVTDETRDVVRRALRLMRDQAEAARERDKLHATGCDLVALVELLAHEHVDPTTMTPVKERMMRAKLNKHRKVLGLPSPRYDDYQPGGDDA